jgi:hypothetical protein
LAAVSSGSFGSAFDWMSMLINSNWMIFLLNLSLDLSPHDDCFQSSCKNGTFRWVQYPFNLFATHFWVRGCYDCLPFTLNACPSRPVTYWTFTTTECHWCGITVVISQSAMINGFNSFFTCCSMPKHQRSAIHFSYWIFHTTRNHNASFRLFG